MIDKQLKLIELDPWLRPYSEIIRKRHELVIKREKELLGEINSLNDFANGYLFYGLHKTNNSWVFREWAPNAKEIYLVGEFNNWKKDKKFKMQRLTNGNWEIILPLDAMNHGQLFKLLVIWEGGEGYRIPSYIKRVIQHEDTKLFDAQIWAPDKPYQWQYQAPVLKNEPLFIYETHVGMSSEDERIATFDEFSEDVLPRIVKAGYNAIQLMAIMEHPYYGSFGYHVSNFFAVSSRFGTPEDLKRLIDTAHGMGLIVIMDLVHSHSVKNVLEGLAEFDGTPYQYFHTGQRRYHLAWDSLCFNYGKLEVLHFLLSNCKFWLEEYKFDGFRFDGVTSMIYYDHGLGKNFVDYSMYYDGNQDEDAIVYLTLANKLIHQVNENAITIAEEVSGMPGLATSFEYGGYGFDFRLAMGVPDYWIKIIKELPDEKWNVGEIFYELTRKRIEEKTISYTESHDQALVGDKTIIFRLVDKDMYFFMHKNIQNINVDRGIALHKMIRLITIATADFGYLNFMGNEFGHPEWIDFPREGNNWSFKYARRQWSLFDNKELKYQYLGDFDKDMIELFKHKEILKNRTICLLHENQNDQTLAFYRDKFLFVFNFNPLTSFVDYSINVPPGKYKIILNTDDKKYGGFDRIDQSLIYYSFKPVKLSQPAYIKIYLPSRTGLVFEKIPVKSVYDI